MQLPTTIAEFRNSFRVEHTEGRAKVVAEFHLAPDEKHARLCLARLTHEELKALAGFYEWKKSGDAQELTDRLIDLLFLLRWCKTQSLEALGDLSRAEQSKLLARIGKVTSMGNRTVRAGWLLNWAANSEMTLIQVLSDSNLTIMVNQAIEQKHPIPKAIALHFKITRALETIGYILEETEFRYHRPKARYSYNGQSVSKGTLLRLQAETESHLSSTKNAQLTWQERIDQYTREQSDPTLHFSRREFAASHLPIAQKALEQSQATQTQLEANLRAIAESLNQPQAIQPAPPKLGQQFLFG